MTKYNTPIEVTENQYKYIMYEFAGLVAGKQSAGKFYIKIWVTKYKSYIENALKQIQ